MPHKIGNVTAIIRDPECRKIGLVGVAGNDDLIICCISTNVDTHFVQGDYICSYRIGDVY
jgi:hypothetical protein